MVGKVFLLLAFIIIGFSIVSPLEFSHGEPSLFVEKVIPQKEDCIRADWNQHFEDYRGGVISKEDMKKYIKGCKW